MSTQTFADRRSLEGAKPGVVVVGGLLALMWVLEIIDSASFHALDQLGIIARNIGSLPHILTAPWLHFGFPHLISNSVPFLILGLLTWLAGPGRWLAVTLITVVTSGLTVWLIAPSNTITLGASGLVFGYLAYLLVRGFFTRNIWEIALSVAVFFFYGSILLGVLPGASGVSWQGTSAGPSVVSSPRSSSTAATPPPGGSDPDTDGTVCWPYHRFAGRIDVRWPHSAGKREQGQQTHEKASKSVTRPAKPGERAAGRGEGQMMNSGTRGTSRNPVNRSSSGIIVGTFETTSW